MLRALRTSQWSTFSQNKLKCVMENERKSTEDANGDSPWAS